MKHFLTFAVVIFQLLSISCSCDHEKPVDDPPPPYTGGEIGKPDEDKPDNPDQEPAPEGFRVIGYLPTSASSYEPRWDKLDVINLSFARVKADGTIDDAQVRKVFSGFADKAHEHGVKVMVSLGGASNIDPFNTALVDSEARVRIVEGCVKLMQDLKLDGIDVDYEGWDWGNSPGNVPKKEGYLDLITKMREALGEDALLTAALGGNATETGFYTREMLDQMDYVTLMAYDKTGSWSSNTGPHAPFEYLVSFTQDCIEAGLPLHKIIPGLPFYGNIFPGNKPENARAMSYNEIITKYPGAEDRDSYEDIYLWYDGKPMITKKCNYVVDNKLGGVMIWQLAQDSPDDSKSLLCLIDEILGSAE